MIKMTIVIFFFNDTATTEIYTLSLHDALPIYERLNAVTLIGEPRRVEIATALLTQLDLRRRQVAVNVRVVDVNLSDRKSTRLNSSHANISYAVFCLKKKNTPSSSLSPTI